MYGKICSIQCKTGGIEVCAVFLEMSYGDWTHINCIYILEAVSKVVHGIIDLMNCLHCPGRPPVRRLSTENYCGLGATPTNVSNKRFISCCNAFSRALSSVIASYLEYDAFRVHIGSQYVRNPTLDGGDICSTIHIASGIYAQGVKPISQSLQQRSADDDGIGATMCSSMLIVFCGIHWVLCGRFCMSGWPRCSSCSTDLHNWDRLWWWSWRGLLGWPRMPLLGWCVCCRDPVTGHLQVLRGTSFYRWGIVLDITGVVMALWAIATLPSVGDDSELCWHIIVECCQQGIGDAYYI